MQKSVARVHSISMFCGVFFASRNNVLSEPYTSLIKRSSMFYSLSDSNSNCACKRRVQFTVHSIDYEHIVEVPMKMLHCICYAEHKIETQRSDVFLCASSVAMKVHSLTCKLSSVFRSVVFYPRANERRWRGTRNAQDSAFAKIEKNANEEKIIF